MDLLCPDRLSASGVKGGDSSKLQRRLDELKRELDDTKQKLLEKSDSLLDTMQKSHEVRCVVCGVCVCVCVRLVCPR